jgi:hypothetical protein
MKKNNDFRHFLDEKNKHLKKNHSGNAAKLTAVSLQSVLIRQVLFRNFQPN